MADWTARELSNRQLLLEGTGAPAFDAPLDTEYTDVATNPPTRYRKLAAGPSGWVLYRISRPATQAEVDAGNDNEAFVTARTLSIRLDALASQLGGGGSERVELLADNATNGADFTVTIPAQSAGAVLAGTVTGYGIGATLTSITGGVLGQILVIQRGTKENLKIASNAELKLVSNLTMSDLGEQDNLTLQRVSPTHWVELTRTLF